MAKVLNIEVLPGSVVILLRAKTTSRALLLELDLDLAEAETAIAELQDAVREARAELGVHSG